MKIRIADKNIGECNIDVKDNINKSAEYTIKSLCMLQMMCMHENNDEKFTQFIEIVKDAISKINLLYHDNTEDNENTDPISHLGS